MPSKKATENPWLTHVKQVMAENPNMKFKDILKKAKASYVKEGEKKKK